MRPLWTGALSFGLVSIPIGLYPAIRHKASVDLDLLRDSDHSRIRYKKVAEADGEEVPREHIVKGYEFEKGHYVVLTEDDFNRVQIKSNQTVEITEFVKTAEIDIRGFGQPYFLGPLKAGAKAYGLLRTALEQTELAGVAKVVICPPREHLAIVKALDGALLLETLHFADELRSPSDLEIPAATVSQKELDMAVSLIKAMTTKWQPEKYHDEYRSSLMKLVEEKMTKGSPAKAAARARKPAAGKVIDLVSLLRESLGKSGKGRKGETGLRHRVRLPSRKAA